MLNALFRVSLSYKSTRHQRFVLTVLREHFLLLYSQMKQYWHSIHDQRLILSASDMYRMVITCSLVLIIACIQLLRASPFPVPVARSDGLARTRRSNGHGENIRVALIPNGDLDLFSKAGKIYLHRLYLRYF